jgi:hypothetical protein
MRREHRGRARREDAPRQRVTAKLRRIQESSDAVLIKEKEKEGASSIARIAEDFAASSAPLVAGGLRRVECIARRRRDSPRRVRRPLPEGFAASSARRVAGDLRYAHADERSTASP